MEIFEFKKPDIILHVCEIMLLCNGVIYGDFVYNNYRNWWCSLFSRNVINLKYLMWSCIDVHQWSRGFFLKTVTDCNMWQKRKCPVLHWVLYEEKYI